MDRTRAQGLRDQAERSGGSLRASLTKTPCVACSTLHGTSRRKLSACRGGRGRPYSPRSRPQPTPPPGTPPVPPPDPSEPPPIKEPPEPIPVPRPERPPPTRQ